MMQDVEFYKLYNILLRKLKGKIILWKNLPWTDHYTNPQDNNIQRHGIWTNANKSCTALPDCHHTGKGTIILELN